MDKAEINNLEDLYCALDKINDSVDWNSFYENRTFKAPFLVNNTLPDKAVTEFLKTHRISDAVEFGCGEGRNAVYLAKNNVNVVALDASEAAIRNAKKKALGSGNPDFICCDCFSYDFQGRKFDLAVDSGLFHHLAPHRRLQYRDLLKSVLRDDGFFLLLCFAAGAGGADELDDLQFYLNRNTGVSFSEERIRRFFASDFEIVSIQKCSQEITDTYIEIPFLYSCVLRVK